MVAQGNFSVMSLLGSPCCAGGHALPFFVHPKQRNHHHSIAFQA
jgi:hypothetical protein